ncbi:MAG: DUF3267 domain-containing protein [Planctomycetia bacterium]|nr:DUF3267 domain-containing protein [Planctomycetia bacterium]
MRLHVGSLPEGDFAPDETWHALREPGPAMMQVYAAPIAIVLGLLVGLAWQSLGLSMSVTLSGNHAIVAIVFIVLSFPAMIAFHELLHYGAFPAGGHPDDKMMGVWPSRMMFYAHYLGEITRTRFLVVLLLPFLVISILPLVLAALIPLPPWLLIAFAWCSVWNALFACGDMFAVGLILAQVPAMARLRNRGYHTFWTTASPPPTS